MNIKRALATPGFMDEKELEYLAHLASKSYMIAEIGSWSGRSTRAFADNTPGVMICVDTWSDVAFGSAPAEQTDKPDWLFNAFKKNVVDCQNVVLCRMTSVEGAAHARTSGLMFDLIFIDAGHEYEEVRADILAWQPLLTPDGILCGHDLYADGPYHPGVLQAVNELVPRYTVHGTIWSTE